MIETGYVKAIGIYYKTTIESIRKSKNYLQPIFEAFINSLESLGEIKLGNKQIVISLYYTSNLTSDENNDCDYSHIKVYDSGLGFNSDEFERFKNLNDNNKGYSNNGNGRVQYVHFFKETSFVAVSYNEKYSSGYEKKKFSISKSDEYLKNNALIKIDSIGEALEKKTYTEVIFKKLLNKNDEKKYAKLTIELLKRELIEYYLDYFCENRNNLPLIKIEKIIDNKLDTEIFIKSQDIPTLDKEEFLSVPFRIYSTDGRSIKKSDDTESFKLKVYKIPSDRLDKNALMLTSKGQIVRGDISKKIKLDSLTPKDIIDGNRYLFLLSGDYLNSKDSDTRGELKLYTLEEFKSLSSDESILDLYKEILLEDIVIKANETIKSIYPEIAKKIKDKDAEIRELRDMFLLNDKTIDSIKNKISIQDTEAVILKKIYRADSEIIAKKDIEIKEQIDKLNKLDTSSKEYEKNLNTMVRELVKIIPVQNRTALAHYIARRKLVLDLFGKILKKELSRQKDKQRNIDEKLLHNLIFQQTYENTEESDLWLINEDFIYYKGTSEKTLGDIRINGERILKEQLTGEEEAYKLKQQGNVNKNRPDILLFPSEGKCILIEFKAPNVNVSEHLNQLNRYASLINNLSKDKYDFTTYYGYLIGENIDIDDVIDNDSDFVSAESLNYIFRPYKRIAAKFNKKNGSLYTEIIKYSTILERAKRRNEIFIKKLMENL